MDKILSGLHQELTRIAPPGRRELRFATGAILISIASFVAALPFATKPWIELSGFIPAYESALIICDLITAVLLFGRFSLLRSPAIFLLASGYLYTSCLMFVHAVSFPGAFSPNGLLGGWSQTAAWLYVFWHAGFPCFVIAFAQLSKRDAVTSDATGTSVFARGPAWTTILIGIASVFAAACVFTLVSSHEEPLLPELISGGRFTWALTVIVSGISLLGVLAIILLWRRPRTTINLWVLMVMCAWTLDIALSAVLNGGRFDLGWYLGRIYGLAAAASLLIVLLMESRAFHARLIGISEALGLVNKALEVMARQDSLTSLANRRSFDEYLAAQFAIARRYDRPLALVLCDIDSFKDYNDHYGHQAGDDCLKHVASALSSCCRRAADMAARYGGEEFALILPDTSLKGAVQIAEAARAAVSHLIIPHEGSAIRDHLSISGGVASLKPGSTLAQFIEIVDQALYQAKCLGRNQMVCETEESLDPTSSVPVSQSTP